MFSIIRLRICDLEANWSKASHFGSKDLILQRIAGMMPRPRRRVTAVTAPIRSTPLQRLDHAATPVPAPPAAPFGPSSPAQPRSPAALTSPAPPEPPVRTMDTFAEAPTVTTVIILDKKTVGF
ncbi:hypothetical protein J6590_024489 [Homalodisca vitripennis]|nr:hypothetical protein J6590_024489 [Homalodisca vitripennis]